LSFALALLLISLIPSQGLVTSNGYPSVPPQTFQNSPFILFLTPQQNLALTATINGKADIALLATSPSEVVTWIETHNVTTYTFNVKNLEAYLSANQQRVVYLRTGVTNQSIDYDFAPSTVTNATLIFSNPGSKIVNISFQVAVNAQLAPATAVRSLSVWTFMIGVLCVLPESWEWWSKHKSK